MCPGCNPALDPRQLGLHADTPLALPAVIGNGWVNMEKMFKVASRERKLVSQSLPDILFGLLLGFFFVLPSSLKMHYNSHVLLCQN